MSDVICRNVEETVVDGGTDEAAERQRQIQRRREEERRKRQAVSIQCSSPCGKMYFEIFRVV